MALKSSCKQLRLQAQVSDSPSCSLRRREGSQNHVPKSASSGRGLKDRLTDCTG
jgi:hypothetical protein